MKFRLCWGTDCPDWLLSEIAAMSAISSLKLRMLVSHVADTVLGCTLDKGKVAKCVGRDGSAASNLSARARVGGIRYILVSAVGAMVPSEVLDRELQQLGLPLEHTATFTKVYSEKLPAMLVKLHGSDGINCCSGNIRTSVTVKGVEVASEIEPVAIVSFNPSTTETISCRSAVHLSICQVKTLLQQLIEAERIMTSLKPC
ncbi:hypothetical protein FHG87_000026 [Trinorchestia longiramus]|nr:hypothetical protein FHG87_000026 [Trinorchestia longiramus]